MERTSNYTHCHVDPEVYVHPNESLGLVEEPMFGDAAASGNHTVDPHLVPEGGEIRGRGQGASMEHSLNKPIVGRSLSHHIGVLFTTNGAKFMQKICLNLVPLEGCIGSSFDTKLQK